MGPATEFVISYLQRITTADVVQISSSDIIPETTLSLGFVSPPGLELGTFCISGDHVNHDHLN